MIHESSFKVGNIIRLTRSYVDINDCCIGKYNLHHIYNIEVLKFSREKAITVECIKCERIRGYYINDIIKSSDFYCIVEPDKITYITVWK